MNKEALLELADHLDNVPEDHFNHGTWGSSSNYSSCGTTACIAGHEVWRTNPTLFARLLSDGGTSYIADLAKAQLGLQTHECGPLFYPWGTSFGDAGYLKLVESNFDQDIRPAGAAAEYSATPKQAAHVIRHFVETGVIDWTVAICPVNDQSTD